MSKSKRRSRTNNRILYIRKDGKLYVQVPPDLFQQVESGYELTFLDRATIVGTVDGFCKRGLILTDWQIIPQRSQEVNNNEDNQ